MQIRRFFSLARRSVQSWLDDYAPSMGAAIAFYTVFSLAPLVMIVIGIAGFFWGEDAVRGELLRQIGGMVGENGAAAIEGVIRSGAEESDQGAAAGLISAGVLLVGATTVFAELQRALDRIWEVPVQEKQSGICCAPACCPWAWCCRWRSCCSFRCWSAPCCRRSGAGWAASCPPGNGCCRA